MGIAFGVFAILLAVVGVAMLSDDDKKPATLTFIACFAFLIASVVALKL